MLRTSTFLFLVILIGCSSSARRNSSTPVSTYSSETEAEFQARMQETQMKEIMHPTIRRSREIPQLAQLR